MRTFKIGEEVGYRTELGLIVRARISGDRGNGTYAVQRFNGWKWCEEEVVQNERLTCFLPMPADRDLYESQVPTSERESTTFTQDFRIAEVYGVAAIQDTYNRAFAGWKNCYKYLTEMAMALNHRLHYWYHAAGEDDAQTVLYYTLWNRLMDWCRANLKGEELHFFESVLD